MPGHGDTHAAPALPAGTAADMAAIIEHHRRTRHHPRRYAPGPGAMDWDSEPDPFRRYRGARLLALDHLPPGPGDPPGFDAVFDGSIDARAVDRAAVSQLFYDSLALSAWKQHRGARWSLRVNPSSGDLHPTEGYLACGPVAGLCDRPAVLHYCPLVHGLELRSEMADDLWPDLCRGLPVGTVLVGLTSIYWRESWKYGERGFRYSQLDLGHAIAAIVLSAAVMGWDASLLESLPTEALAQLLGVHDQRGIEAEHAECLLAISPRGRGGLDHGARRAWRPSGGAISRIAAGPWLGRPNRLSKAHRDWPTIDDASRATQLHHEPPEDFSRLRAVAAPRMETTQRALSARVVIRKRRSAVAMDGRAGLARAAFYRMLDRTLPGPGAVPFEALPWSPAVHLLLFVHRVQGLAPGLYLLVRDPAQEPGLREAITNPFEWRRPPRCPPGMGLYLLRECDARAAAQSSSCHQEIAADGAFAAAMIAEFEPRLERHGPWFYRRLHWEAGAVGQVLYLEAEAAGLAATGIGCFFDDMTHDLLGFTDLRYQTLYHFTVGGPVEDARLTSLPGYPPPQDQEPRV